MNDADKLTALEAAADWYVRRDAGPLDPREEAQFQDWLMTAANRIAFEEISGTWIDLGLIPRPAVEAVAANDAGRVVPLRAIQRRPMPIRRWTFAAAAAAVAVFVVGHALDLPLRFEADAMTATGEIRTLRLDDGSSVELNTASALAIDYSPSERRIRLLRGEAVFTVAKDSARPFVVEAASGTAVARGTVFAVGKDGDGATVTVLESRVGVSYPASAGAVELSPGEAVAYSRRGLDNVRAVDADTRTAWRRGKLVFVDRPLGEVIAELNRYYAGRIQIIDDSISNKSVSGVFDIRDPARALHAVEEALGLHSTSLTSYLVLLHS
ncbi:sensor [Azorhizobium oxalatiphilum]|uniref:Sensor n=1 Tax=Azorhizobium oxalatiphilum TaxID=980631 RepID=A0A917FA59_9HYPH|nr:FecR family protein [Azorhizobium oxalatiphilum]GGF63809.1 sensor [Azorhizobium oxalatiphilum]